jgi:predicted nuclease of predicted toxin-antitoxin system
MKFKIDENLPGEVAADRRAAGHDAETIVEEGLTGAPDALVMQSVQQERRVLLTMDKGIGDIRAYPPAQFAGIVLFRPGTQGRGSTMDFIRRHLPALLAAPLDGRLLVVSDSGIRVR